MKTSFSILLLTLSIVGHSQAIFSDNSGMIFLNKNTSKNESLEGRRGGYFGTHSLGGDIQKKYDQFLKLYVKYEQSGGAYATEEKIIFKKEIYKSVNRLNSYYKKSLKKGTIELPQIVNEYSHILDVVNEIRFFETKELELFLSTAKDESQIIFYFNSIKFKDE